jgi:hypothetical protein
VIPTTGNAAPVQQFVANIGGTTVYLPAGQQYQTVILNPGIASTSGAGSQQIILHPQASNMPPTAYLQQQHHHQQHQSQATSQQVGPHFYIQPHHQQQQHTQNSLGAQIQVNGVISTSSAAHMSSGMSSITNRTRNTNSYFENK